MIEDPVLSLLSGTDAILLSLIFGQSMVAKSVNLDAFVRAINGYALIPIRISTAVARGLLLAEMLVILTVLVPESRLAGACFAIVLLLGYALAIAVNLARGRLNIDCGCGGVKQPISSALVLRNILIASCAIPLLAVSPNSLSLGQTLVAGMSGITLWLVLAVGDQLLANLSNMRRKPSRVLWVSTP
jgi:hypothetical protein